MTERATAEIRSEPTHAREMQVTHPGPSDAQIDAICAGVERLERQMTERTPTNRTVYVVIYAYYDDWIFHGVFSTKEKAQAYIDTRVALDEWRNTSIDEYVLDDPDYEEFYRD